MSGNEISHTDNIIDSRDVIERIEELEGELAEVMEELDAFRANPANDPLSTEWSANIAPLYARKERIEVELLPLQTLAKQGEDYCPDWKYGEALIRDSYFKTYAQEFADDIGAIDRNATWPLTCIDWERAARELQMDYTALDFGGVRYWAR